MTGDEAAHYYGVSRRTLYRWAEEGRLEAWEWGRKVAYKRPRGPRRKPYSIRYNEGRHNFVTTRNP